MPFILPTFVLPVNIWRVGGIGGTYAAPDVQTFGNLSPGKRTMLQINPASGDAGKIPMELLLPPLTDIRAAWNSLNADLVEVPAGSTRFYNVQFVDDIGKGFANEHRFAMLYQLEGTPGVEPFGQPWPVPMP